MRKLLGLFLAIIIISLAMAGCEELPENQKTTAPKPGETKAAATANPADAYPVKDNQSGYPGGDILLAKIVKADTTSVDLKLSDLGKLTKVKITADGKAQEGFKLLDILAQAKVSSFNKVTISDGKKTVTLAKGDVDDQVIINLGDGLTLISSKLKADQWLKYVTQIKVE